MEMPHDWLLKDYPETVWPERRQWGEGEGIGPKGIAKSESIVGRN